MEASTTKLLTTQEIAKRLDVGTSTVLAMARTGQIPSVRVGGCGRRYCWDEVLTALRLQGTSTTPNRCEA